MNDSTLSFEQALAQLHDAVDALEAGGLPLDEAVALFERGMRLVAVCGHHLDQTELRVVEIEAALRAASERGDRHTDDGDDDEDDGIGGRSGTQGF